MRLLHRWLIITLFNSAALQASIYVVRPMITYRALELNGTGKTVGILGKSEEHTSELQSH